jgi:hypothetical protein
MEKGMNGKFCWIEGKMIEKELSPSTIIHFSTSPPSHRPHKSPSAIQKAVSGESRAKNANFKQKLFIADDSFAFGGN